MCSKKTELSIWKWTKSAHYSTGFEVTASFPITHTHTYQSQSAAQGRPFTWLCRGREDLMRLKHQTKLSYGLVCKNFSQTSASFPLDNTSWSIRNLGRDNFLAVKGWCFRYPVLLFEVFQICPCQEVIESTDQDPSGSTHYNHIPNVWASLGW